MTKDELVKLIANEAKISSEEAEEVLDIFVKSISDDLKTKGKEAVLNLAISDLAKSDNYKQCGVCNKLQKTEETICDGCGNVC